MTRRLLVAYADLGQLAGWMASDSERDGLAQRYYLTALHAAHSANDKLLAAHVVSSMAYHAAHREQATDATSLGTAAMELASRAPVIVQALVSSRLAYGYALDGDPESFHAAYDRARELVENPIGHRPRWAYYVSPEFVEVGSAYSHLLLGMADSPGRRRHLRSTVTLLTRSGPAQDSVLYPRAAVLAGTGLARAHVGLGNLEQACEVGRTVVQWLPQVHSPRCVTGLRCLADELRARKVNCHVRDFSAELDHNLKLLA